MSSVSLASQSSSNIGDNITYIGLIRRSEGNVLIIFASLTLGLIIVGTCIFVFCFRARRFSPERFVRVRRCTTSALYTVENEKA
ncbi:hypothetical protein ABB37_01486 [Leptomonas pyrrhocoris]|uniref:Uncharacterized protein n=1 Tax=Leptomonas pyrrhocoris TaxID=157538 RepID=A0A0M9G8U5_LEPPY|nr:hypothetical protein ABB37_01486 [Leptomonas pyrrhocoris]KPA85073.1 hypothetical protein ABB37_01486 [Leptomonas pyrrhocoris]|eukprot:XP_015663512.1 hypothetical protein ABB37_01486 [Leptomonas pyrrhocoris]